LTVPSGTVIRCSSTATIAGTIFVLPAPNGATVKRSGSASLLIAPAYQAPTAVSGFSAAAAGELSLLGSGTIAGGDGGAAVSSISGTTAGLQFFSLLFRGSNITGGGGAASIGLNTSGFGGGGGGSFALIAKQTISLTGTLNVVGGSTSSPGAGGGSGGFAVLASGQSVTVTGSGVISAVGTNGGNSDASVGAGGGGGGGIIQIIAPTVPAQITIDGFTDIEGGSAGSIAVNQSSANIRQAGSGGGGLGGEGGDGGIVSSAAGTQSPSSASAGLPGFASAIAADPAALLLY
jgi:hypothetical protein